MARILCLFGFHLRSRGRAHEDARGFVSICKRCRAPMRRGRDGVWRLDRDV